MKEYIKCNSDKEFKIAQKYFFKRWFKYLSDKALKQRAGLSKLKFKDIDPEYKKEMYVLLIDWDLFHAIPEICAVNVENYIERDLEGNIIDKTLFWRLLKYLTN